MPKKLTTKQSLFMRKSKCSSSISFREGPFARICTSFMLFFLCLETLREQLKEENNKMEIKEIIVLTKPPIQ